MAEINNTIFIHGEIGTEVTPEMVIPQIDAAIANKVKEITVDISSHGGSVFAGREIIGGMERAKMAGIIVKTRCLSYAYSMGAMIFASGTKGERKLSDFAELMFHKANGGIEGSITTIESYLNMLKDMSKNLFDYLVKGNEGNSDAIQNCFESEKMIGASEAIQLGLADGIVDKLKAVAYFDTNKIDMKKENIDEAKSLLQIIRDGIKNMFHPEIKNASKDGLYYEGEFAVGTKVFSDEAMTTPAPDGVHGDVTISGGEVSSIAAEAEDSAKELAEAIAKVAELQNALDQKETALNELKTANELKEAENQKKIDAMMVQVDKLNGIVLGEEGRHREENDNNDTPLVETVAQKMKRLDAENRKKYSSIIN